MPLDRADIIAAFESKYGVAPTSVVRAPGRVNLIGEHTDYNDGFVLPMAIDRAVWIAWRPRSIRRVEVFSADFNETGIFVLDPIEHGPPAWLEYVRGVAWSLQEAGHDLAGWEGVLMGDVPQGAGLSSSAALEMAVARVFTSAAGGDEAWDAVAMARLAQRAENDWVGMRCGIMDQLISGVGQADHAVLIDCRTLESRAVPLPAGTAVAILDTGTRRGLVDSAYNERREQCEAAAEFFGVTALRDVTMDQFLEQSAGFDELTKQRARHVVTENERTLSAAEALLRGDAAAVGSLMNKSHQSLRDDYEVSSEALDNMVACAREHSACYGARLTGAGFGGCCVALIDAKAANDFVSVVGPKYTRMTGPTPSIYICRATDGAGVV